MNDPINFEKFRKINCVYILSEINDEFEKIYLKIREKEKRIYSDEELKNLPFVSGSSPHKKEWILRAKSFLRFRNYLGTKRQNLNILDLGCGNGWFSGRLSKSFKNNFFCVDVNLTELQQGRRSFDSSNLNFMYADIFSVNLPERFYDIIIVSAAIQYFQDLKLLLHRLFRLLAEKGEVHIIDSPIYSEYEVVDAKQRTYNYYTTLGFSEMANNYHHHSWNELNNFKYNKLFDPSSVINRIKNIIVTDSPFPWIKIIR